jgi:50S ribosomal protein L16 3-hydroxylase
MKFLGGMSSEKFLSDYWEKKPLLIRNAFPDAAELASPEDLKELAFDEEFETRLITNGEEITVKEGPLSEKDFEYDLWTLACHNLNTLSCDLYRLQEAVNFIPSWLFDDVMATYSKEDATVGAHIDKYNVFILQGSGKRIWRLQENPDSEYLEGKPLKLLKNFNPNIEWELNPGDMIYIPSSVAHEGTTLEESISYSIGFKSLEDQNLINSFLTDCLENIETEEYFKIQNLQPQMDQNLISPEIISSLYSRIHTRLNDKNLFKRWLISHLTTPKEDILPSETYLEEDVLELAKRNHIFRDQLTRFNSFQEEEEEEYILSINKALYRIEKSEYPMISTWFIKSFDQPITIDFEKLNNDTWPLGLDLFRSGIFYFSEE